MINVFIIKLNQNGDSIWSKTYGGIGNDFGNSVQQTNDGGYVICGETWSSTNGFNDVYIIKTDQNGDSIWTKKIGGNNQDFGKSIQQTNDGGYIITGASNSFGGSNRIYLVKTDGNGNVTSTFNIAINPNRKLEKTVDILGRETKGKKNQPLFYIYDDGTVEKKIIIE